MEKSDRHEIIISFQVCKNCKFHGWNTRHEEYKYDEHFDSLSKLIRTKLAGVRIAKNVVPLHLHRIAGQMQLQNKYYDQNKQDLVQFPEIGAFQISVFNILIFSKLKLNVWPSYTRVIALLTQIIQDYRAGKSIESYSKEDRLRSISLKEAQPKKLDSSSKKLSVLRNSDLTTQSKGNSNLKVRLIKNMNGLSIDKRAPLKLQKVGEQRVQRIKRFERPERESEQDGFEDNRMRLSLKKDQQLQNKLKVKLKEFQIRQKQIQLKEKESLQTHSAQVSLLNQRINRLTAQLTLLQTQNSSLKTHNQQLLKRLKESQKGQAKTVIGQDLRPMKLPKFPLRVKLTKMEGRFKQWREEQGFIDPYLQITVNKVKVKTQTIDEGGAEVKWQKTLQQQLNSGKDAIMFQAFDQDLMTSDLLGSAQISAEDLLKWDHLQTLKLFLNKQESGQIKFQVSII